ncbi:hypothetical protein ABIE56_000226 [Luteibacter sp. 621]|uniref:hypothetical protein n=1 Tax=Luteibacter sp. 621 TaxID=3373916 RepID=UPI003D1EB09A
MSLRALPSCVAFIAVTSTAAPAATQQAPAQMPLADFVGRVIPLVPGTTADVEALFGVHDQVHKTSNGWRHSPIRFRTADGVSLEITLTSDWNAKTPDIVRLVAGVDAQQCIDAARVRGDLSDGGRVEWTAIGNDQGWTATIQGRLVALAQRTGHYLASVIVDTRRQPRPVQPTRPCRIGPSGHVEPVPVPGH